MIIGAATGSSCHSSIPPILAPLPGYRPATTGNNSTGSGRRDTRGCSRRRLWHGRELLYLAGLGHNGVGIDISPTAIDKARQKAESRRQRARFIMGDALRLDELRTHFDSVIDCGLFHTFSDDMRRIFTRSLRSVLRAQGTYFMLCFSEHEPEDWGGPRRVNQKEIRDTFDEGWRINYIREARFETNWPQVKGRAWLSSITLAPVGRTARQPPPSADAR